MSFSKAAAWAFIKKLVVNPIEFYVIQAATLKGSYWLNNSKSANQLIN